MVPLLSCYITNNQFNIVILSLFTSEDMMSPQEVQQRQSKASKRSNRNDNQKRTRTLGDNPDFYYMTKGIRGRPH